MLHQQTRHNRLHRLLTSGVGAALFGLGRQSVYPVVMSLMFGLVFAASLFFNGMYIEYFALSMSGVMLVFFIVLWRGYSQGLRVPKTPLSVMLTLFWAWLAVTLLWSNVPYVSMVNFWWVGSSVFVFWLITLTPERNSLFRGIFVLLLIMGLVLALLSIYQQLSLGIQAQSTFLTRNSHAGLMCLLAIPVSSHFLLAHDTTRLSVWKTWLLGPALYVLYFSIALTSSRGATLGLLMGLAIVVVLAYRYLPWTRLVVFLVIVLTAYVAADVMLQGEVSDRLGTLVKLAKADPGRFLIWQQSWRLLMDSPWWGIGLGTYWLHWPPYRHPADGSAGFYVHNDYLQLWIEIGLPGLLLLLGVYVAVLVIFIRVLRWARTDVTTTIESAGLFGGLLAIAVHTFFDFDLYIHPIQLVLGLVLARLHALYLAQTPIAVVVLDPARWLGKRSYRAIVSLIVLTPIVYFTLLGASTILTYRAHDLVTQGKLVEANTALTRAGWMMPTSDIVLTSHADLLRQAALKLPPGSVERRLLYQEALAMLDDAEKVNPLRPQTFFIRGLLCQQNPDLTGTGWVERATQAYVAALKRDPMAFWARESYARLLLAEGKGREARDVLEGGIAYLYGGAGVIGYYKLTAEVRRQQGDTAGALELTRKIAEILGQPFNPPTRVPIGTMALQHSG